MSRRSARSEELDQLLRAASELLASWPLPADDESRWRSEALCRGTDPEFFYPGRGEPVDPSRSVCRQCPVRVPCLASALANGEKFGTWGGVSEHERRALRRRLAVGLADPGERRTA